MTSSADFLGALGTAATSTLAFAAYIATIAAWVMIAWRVRRNKGLLEHLSSLPESDRIEALRMEMGVVPVARGLSPEQLLRSRVHGYYLIGFALICLTLITIVAMAWFSPDPGGLSGNVDLHQ
jgi:hypothetical protein